MWITLYLLFVFGLVLNSVVFMCLDFLAPKLRYYPVSPYKLKTQYKSYFPCVLFNLVVSLPVFLLLTIDRFLVLSNDDLTPLKFLAEMFFFTLLFEFFFYLTHRILHQRYFFRWIHYKHHEMIDSIGMGAIYCHPVEMFFSNYLPFALPVFLYNGGLLESIYCNILNWFFAKGKDFLQCYSGVHFDTVCIWTLIAGVYIVFSHCGYPFPHKNPKHLWHHRFLNRNYGTLGISDYVFGTL